MVIPKKVLHSSLPLENSVVTFCVGSRVLLVLTVNVFFIFLYFFFSYIQLVTFSDTHNITYQ